MKRVVQVFKAGHFAASCPPSGDGQYPFAKVGAFAIPTAIHKLEGVWRGDAGAADAVIY